jgi:SRSO17 transposase
MLPIIHTWKEGSMSALIDTTAKMDLAIHDLESLVEDLRADHAIYSPLLQRREQREAAPAYLQGLLAALPRKSIAPLGLAVEGVVPTAVRAMQACLSEGPWDDERLLHRHGQEVERALGPDAGVLRVDGRDVPTQGCQSAGVTRQDGGELGQRANGQAGVFVGDVSSQGDTRLDRRRYLPRAWSTEDAYAARRRRCGMPPAMMCKTKPELAEERLAAVVTSQRLRCRWVVADEAFGGDPDLLDGVARWGRWSVAEVPHTTRLGDVRPATHVPMGRGRGRPPPRLRWVAGAPDARPVPEVATALPPGAWSRQTSKEGRQGPRVAACAACRVIAVRDAWPGPDVWLVLRRHRETGEVTTSRCHAPVDTPWATQVRLSGRRWPMDTCVEDGKQRLGRGDDDVRSWAGWHHHLTLVILAHVFVVRLQRRFKKSARSHATSGRAAVDCRPAPARV